MIASTYYNEIDPHAAGWLGNLIRAGLVAPGTIDTRDIRDVSADDVRGFRRCHWFAGIGGWDLALQLAGWPDSRPVWTGSCPCQPYSSAGKGLGDEDPRNLWPAWFPLIRECRPDVIFGEQVESAIGHGWLDRVSADLEGEGYAVGAIVLGAHSVGAPHIRQRLYWVADARVQRRDGGQGVEGGRWHAPERGQAGDHAGDDRLDGRMADGQGDGWRQGRQDIPGGDQGVRAEGDGRGSADGRDDGRMAHAGSERVRDRGPRQDDGAAGSAEGDGQERQRVRDDARDGDGRPCGLGHAIVPGPQGCGAGLRGGPLDRGRGEPPTPAGDDRPWSRYALAPCRDGKARRFEPGSFPLAHGLPGRVGRLRGYGNAIVPQVAAEFVRALMDTEENPVRA